MIYHHLERCGGVSEAKEHDGGFKQAFMREEGRFPFVAGFDTDVVVSPTVMILDSLPPIFPHFFDHFSFYYASPFASSAFLYFSEHSPWFLLYSFTHDTTSASFPYGTISFYLSWTASTCQLITYYLIRPPSPFKVVPLISWPTRGCQHPYDSFIP